jgi:Fe-S cluster biogenesis protein NfuA/nitrite reductase/ring-hydroxylating ferredoxin subunit
VETQDRQAAECIQRVEDALDRLDGLPPPASDDAFGAMQAMLELYGEGLRRILSIVGPDPVEGLVGDELVGHLLVLHGLHPVPVHQRVAHALDEVLPYLRSHGGGAELLGVADGVATLRLEGTCDGCPSSAVTLKQAVEEAILRAAPELERVEAQGASPPPDPDPVPAFGSLPVLQVGAAAAEDAGDAQAGPRRDGHGAATDGWFWAVLSEPAVPEGTISLDQVLGRGVLFANVEGTLLAYRPTCPVCEGLLQDGVLAGAELRCGGCGHRYDLRRAGRCLDTPSQRGLDPLPLLATEPGSVKVAVAQVGGR